MHQHGMLTGQLRSSRSMVLQAATMLDLQGAAHPCSCSRVQQAERQPCAAGCKQVASARSAAQRDQQPIAAQAGGSSLLILVPLMFALPRHIHALPSAGVEASRSGVLGGNAAGGARRHHMPCSARGSCVCLPCKVCVLMGGCSNMAGCRKPHRHHPSPSCRSSLSPSFARTGSHSA